MTKSPLALACLVLGAACTHPPPPPPAATGAPAAHGYALVYELLGQEKDVSKLLIVKRESDDLEAVIDAISETAGRAYEDLGELGEADPSLNLTDNGLPAGERAAREAITESKRNALLAESGEEFEIQLVLAQSEALGYLVGLTEGLSRSEPDRARLAFVQALWRDAKRLQESLLGLLRTRYRRP